MANTALDALAGEDILESNSLGTVMRHCVVLKTRHNDAETVISLAVITSAKSIKTSYPGLLVIACSAFLVAAAAACSKQGAGAARPFAFIGLLFVVAYWLSRRASVAITAGSEITESVQGSPSDASKFTTALRFALEREQRLAA
jgi:hypothetical protein